MRVCHKPMAHPLSVFADLSFAYLPVKAIKNHKTIIFLNDENRIVNDTFRVANQSFGTANQRFKVMNRRFRTANRRFRTANRRFGNLFPSDSLAVFKSVGKNLPNSIF